jgi:tetratricopeptide (TPR) repeat protein
MRRHFLLVSTFAATVGVAAFGFADPPAPKGGASVGLSVGGAAQPPTGGAKPATSGSVGVSSSASGTSPTSTAASSASARTGGAKPATSAAAAIARGHAAFTARDYPGAIQAYQEATQRDASDVAAYYFLGEAHLAGGSTAEADASFASGLRYAGGKDDWRAKLLFAIADLRERQGKWGDARKAWDEYGQFVSTHPNIKGYGASATERAKVVDARAELDTKYAPVKQRIEQRRKESGSIPNAADETKKK